MNILIWSAAALLPLSKDGVKIQFANYRGKTWQMSLQGFIVSDSLIATKVVLAQDGDTTGKPTKYVAV